MRVKNIKESKTVKRAKAKEGKAICNSVKT